MRICGLVFVLAFASVLSIAPLSLGVVEASCQRVELTGDVGIVASAVWGPAEEALWLADSMAGALLKVSIDGNFVERVEPRGRNLHELFRPARILRHGQGYVVLEMVDRLIWHDGEMQPLFARDLRQHSSTSELPDDITSLALTDPVLIGSELYAYGFLQPKGESSKVRSFLHFRLDPKFELVEQIRQIPWDSPAAPHYAFHPYVVAVAGDRAWGLSFAEPPSIFSLSPPHQVLKTFPPGFEQLPTLTHSRPGSFAAVFRRIALSTTPTALLGHGEFLYLLTRRPTAEATLWQLHQIDPRTDRLLKTVDLPTVAPHLIVVPGAKRWAVLEAQGLQEPAEGTPRQPIPSMLLIDSQWITNPETKASGQLGKCSSIAP